MTLAINLSAESKTVSKETNPSKKLLQAYLNEAVALTAGKPKSEAKRIIEDYHKKSDILKEMQGQSIETKIATN